MKGLFQCPPQGNALGYYGCKPVALKGQKLSSRDNIL